MHEINWNIVVCTMSDNQSVRRMPVLIIGLIERLTPTTVYRTGVLDCVGYQHAQFYSIFDSQILGILEWEYLVSDIIGV